MELEQAIALYFTSMKFNLKSKYVHFKFPKLDFILIQLKYRDYMMIYKYEHLLTSPLDLLIF